MNRRSFLSSVALTAAASQNTTHAASSPMKITRVRAYAPVNLNPLFNQSNMVITVETDAGITGVGEGGSKDTIEQCAGRLIGKDPQFIEKLWQDMYRSFFYPPGREKIDALGGLDLALWDIKGKVLGQPVHALLGGLARNYCECYITGGAGGGPTYKEKAQAAIAAGYRAFRMDAASVANGGTTFRAHERIHQMHRDCELVREGVGEDGDWLIDFHQRFDFADALRGCKLLEELEPFLVEDPVRAEAFLEDIPKLRKQTTVPLAAGEEWGQRWDFNKLVENHDLDYVRATLPNTGGITEMKKIAAICETHFVGMVPHFTGPIAEAALVHVLGTFPGPVLFEYNYKQQVIPYLPLYADFKDGKLWPNQRPGLGVELDLAPLRMVTEVTQPITDRILYYRADGSITNW